MCPLSVLQRCKCIKLYKGRTSYWYKYMDTNSHLHAYMRLVYCNNKHWRDVQRKNVVNNLDMSSLRVPWQKSPYKNKHTEQHKNRQNTKTQQTFRKKHNFCVFRFFIFIYNFLNDFCKKSWVTALVRPVTFIGSWNQF